MARRVRKVVLITALVAAGILAAVGLDSRLDVEEYELSFPGLPAGLDGMKIALLSDLHGAEFGEDNEGLINAVRESGAKLVVMAGDLIDCEEQKADALELMERLAEEFTVLYVPGNHEWSVPGTEAFLEELTTRGVRVMLNEYGLITDGEDSILVVGVNDPNGYADQIGPVELMQQAKAAYPGCFTLVLYHRNDQGALFAQLGADLVLSGHAHGGQVRLPFTDGLMDANRTLFPDYTNGPYEFGSTVQFVGRGLGNSVPVPRVFNRPHLPVIILRYEGN